MNPSCRSLAQNCAEYIACLTNERTTFFTASVIVEKKASAGAACRTVKRPQSRPQIGTYILTIEHQRAHKPSLAQHRRLYSSTNIAQKRNLSIGAIDCGGLRRDYLRLTGDDLGQSALYRQQAGHPTKQIVAPQEVINSASPQCPS